MQKTRKSDMDDHLATSHGIGSSRLCNFCGKNMKTKKGVKEHENKVHRKIYKHRSSEKPCKSGTQSVQLYKTHRVRHHGEEKERSFRCKECKKCIDGKNLLNKHIKRKLCKVEKNFKCVFHNPSRWFKTAEGRDRHNKMYHTGDIEKHQCARGKKVWFQDKHDEPLNVAQVIDLLARAKRLRLARESKLKEKGKEAASSRCRIGVSQSAPDKSHQTSQAYYSTTLP